MFCSNFSKKGHNSGDCYKRKDEEANKNGPRRSDNAGRGFEIDDTEEAMTEDLSESKTKQEKSKCT